jgi:putative thioredoxin
VSNLPPSGVNLRGAVDLSSLVHPNGAPAGASVADVPSLVMEGTDANFSAILELSNTVPVVVQFHAGTPSPTLIKLIKEYAGRFVLASVNAATNARLVQAFNALNLPTVAAVIGGRPIALYEGELPEADARSVIEQLAALAAQNGVTGTVHATGPDTDDETVEAEPAEEPLPPHHAEAYAAIAAGDYESAIKEYQTAIAQDPRDQLAVAGLAQVSLLHRLEGKAADALRAAAASDPTDVDAQLDVADLDVAGGHLEDAFDRLLSLFPSLDRLAKEAVRTRLVDYFEIAGAEDPRVIAARRRLTTLLY